MKTPFTLQFGRTGDCEYDAANQSPTATLRGYETLPRNDYESVMNHLATVGPLSIAVDASRWSSYSHGVFSGCDYDRNIEINHGKTQNAENFSTKALILKKCYLQICDVHLLYDRL